MRHGQVSKGFGLAEIIASLLLLSILTVGLFKTSHLIQHSANHQLTQFRALQKQNNIFAISRLNHEHGLVKANTEFIYLNCLLSKQQDC